MDHPGTSPTLRIQLLGGFQVTLDGAGVPGPQAGASAWRQRKPAALVKLLALAPERALHREQALDLLWPRLAPAAAGNNFRKSLHVVRRALRALAPAAAEVVRLDGDRLTLCPAGGLDLWIDAAAFAAAAARARRTGTPADHEAALALYTGDLLPDDRYEDWAAPRREALREDYLGLLLAAARLHEAAGADPAALDLLRRAVAHEPAHEEARVGLMRLHARAGRRHAALREYAQLRDALRRDLAAEPEPATQRLYAAILAGQYPAAAARPAAPGGTVLDAPRSIPPSAAPPRQLPVPLTGFVGRAEALADLRRLLTGAAPESRLVTLTGPGGSGKTRLALAVAAALAATPAYPDGVWFVDLAGLTDPALVPRAVATALQVRVEAQRPLTASLAAALRERRLLLVLDNCEHLVAACADLCAALLAAGPALRVLATSRAPLRVPGELTWRVPPLRFPVGGEAERAGPADDAVVERLATYEAVRLFVARARLAQPAFALTPANARAVAAVCRRLDGMPLALELAAARLGALTVEQLAARLDNALPLLNAGHRTAPARQRTLRATLDWSYALLTDDERRLLRRLAVFAGGWTVEAAEAVTEMRSEKVEVRNDFPGEGFSLLISHFSLPVLVLLAQLADKSLVQVEAGGDAMRYRLLETVRQYARERLREARGEEAFERRHFAYYLGLVETAAPHLTGSRRSRWFDRFAVEHDNLRAALRWCLDHGEAEAGLRLASRGLWLFWGGRGHLAEGRAWLTALLAAPGAGRTATRADALNAAGNLVHLQGDFAAASALHEESLAIRRERGDEATAAGSLNNLGLVARSRGDLAGARALFAEARAINRRTGNRAWEATNLNNLGIIAHHQGDHAAARALHDESLALFTAAGNEWGIAMVLADLGHLARDRDDLPAARAYLADSRARREASGDRRGVAATDVGLGRVALAGGDTEAARACFAAALAAFHELDHRAGIAGALQGFAALAAAWRQPERALRLAGAAAREAELGGSTWDLPALPGLEALRRELGATASAAAWAAGRALAPAEAVAEALAAPPTPPCPDRPAPHLTRRERDVVALLAAGRTNGQIATALGIARRTADTHVGAILRKLRCASRGEVAMWARASGLSVER
ncbi:MAG TPA: tetratricopeptide repeat protein [Thermomicrobiales bacterium]|nr:tetratricopeptide repeat protein [Thermomicrobiales bacterium]